VLSVIDKNHQNRNTETVHKNFLNAPLKTNKIKSSTIKSNNFDFVNTNMLDSPKNFVRSAT
jgi:hypothetical protein